MEHHEHHPSGGTSLVLTILLNSIITIAQFVGGLLSGSLALLSDAGHNLSDVLSLILGYAGQKVSNSEPSAEYSFGLKRFEVLIALVNSVSLLIIGAGIVYEAVQRFKSPEPIDVTILLPVATVGLIGNLFSIIILASHRDENLNMKAAFLHLFYDALSSVAVIIAGVVTWLTGWTWPDIAVTGIIVMMITWSSADIIRQAYRIFLQGTPKDLDTGKLLKDLSSTTGVQSIHEFHVWSLNSREVFLSCHIVMEEGTEGDPLLKNINEMLKDSFDIEHTSIQLEEKDICQCDDNIN